MSKQLSLFEKEFVEIPIIGTIVDDTELGNRVVYKGRNNNQIKNKMEEETKVEETPEETTPEETPAEGTPAEETPAETPAEGTQEGDTEETPQ